MRLYWLPIAALGALTLPGCGGDTAKPLNSDAFYRPQSVDHGAGVGARPAVGPVDEAGQVLPIAHKTHESDSVTGISDVVAESVKPTYVPPGKPLVLAVPTSAPATTAPASDALRLGPATLPTGQYMIVGAVLADVDGTPVYANQVFAAINKELSVRAKDLDENQFRHYAYEEILKERETLIRNEVVYRAAKLALDDGDQKFAWAATARWKQQQITDAGGSEELARRKARADGIDFDQMVEDQHRLYTTEVYYEKKIYPLIIVTADMLRDYYDRNMTTQFTEKTAAKFRVIKVDARDVGSRERAQKRAEEWQKVLAAEPEQFAAFAKEHNTDPYLKDHEGLPAEGMLDRGAYVNKTVEDAAWALQPGQVSDVITVGDVYYIVKLEAKTVGRVKPFDSEEVQDTISKILRTEQLRVLREREEKKLERNAIVTRDDHATNLALEMAMQRYVQWRAN